MADAQKGPRPVFSRVLDGLWHSMMGLCVAALAAMVAIIAWQVFSRQVLHRPPSWSEEMARIIMVWMGLLGAALITRARWHLGVEAAVNLLPPVARRVVLAFADVVVGVFAVFLTFFGAKLTIHNMDHTEPALGIPVGLAENLPMLIAGVIILMTVLEHLFLPKAVEERSD